MQTEHDGTTVAVSYILYNISRMYRAETINWFVWVGHLRTMSSPAADRFTVLRFRDKKRLDFSEWYKCCVRSGEAHLLSCKSCGSFPSFPCSLSSAKFTHQCQWLPVVKLWQRVIKQQLSPGVTSMGLTMGLTHPEECVFRFHPEKGHRTIKHPSKVWQRMRNRRFFWRLFEIPFHIAQQIAAMAATTAMMGSLWGEYPPATQKAPKDSGCGAGAWLPPISCVIAGGTGGRGGWAGLPGQHGGGWLGRDWQRAPAAATATVRCFTEWMQRRSRQAAGE